MNDDLDRLDNWVNPLIEQLSSKQRAKLAWTVSRELAKSQRERIKKQRNPDGTPFEKRSDGGKPINKPIRFYYRKPTGDERVASMASFRDEGDRMIGYDQEVDGIRTFLKSRIQYYMRPKHTGGSLRSQRGRIRKKAMFTKLRQAKYLKAKGSPNAATVGFFGEIAKVAEVHQYGQTIPVTPGGPKADYPVRQLLGFSDQDIEMIQDIILEHLSPRS